MKKPIVILTVMLVGLHVCKADLWQDLKTYQMGDLSEAPAKLEELVKKTAPDQYAAIEDQLIRVLEATETGATGKSYACRMLQRVGTTKCVPVLGKLLCDEDLSHYARLVLERMCGCDQAGAALREGLAKAPPKLKVGIIGSLGARGDVRAVQALCKLAADNDPAVAGAAMTSLGRIGCAEAAKCLNALNAPQGLQAVWLDARINCAKALCAAGKHAEAATICKDVYARNSPAQQIAAVREMIKADCSAAGNMIGQQLKADDSLLRRGVLRLVATEASPALTKAICGCLSSLPHAKQTEVLTALADRGDRTAVESITQYMGCNDQNVREAAVAAVGVLGDAAAVDALLGMVEDPGLSEKAVEALAVMYADGVDQALFAALKSDKRAAAVKALVARNCIAAGPMLVEMTADKEPDIRKSVWAGLAALGHERDMAALMKAMLVAKPEEIAVAQKAIKTICAGAVDKNKCMDYISAHYEGGDDEIKAFILEIGSVLGTDNALALEKKAMNSGNKTLHDKALRNLAAWSSVGAAEELLNVAKTANEHVDKIIALRGYIQSVAHEDNPKKQVGMYDTAKELITRPEEKRLLVSGLRRAFHPDALDRLVELIADPDVKGEAQRAAIDLCNERDMRRNYASDVGSAAEKIAQTAMDKNIVSQANKLANECKGKKNLKER